MIKEIRDITKIDYSNRITIKNPADKNFCLELKKHTNPKPYIHQVYANVLNLFAELIFLYVILENWNEEGINNTQNII